MNSTWPELLESFRLGQMTSEEILAKIRQPSSAQLEYATVDLDRQSRCGFPEVVLAEGKTAAWIEGVVRKLIEAGQDAFATRVSEEQAAHLKAAFPNAIQDRLARTFLLRVQPEAPKQKGLVLVVTAGTGDLPVAQEALVTADVMGAATQMVVDVGVAGIHRILSQQSQLQKADVVIVVAGMDGALPSVVGGLVDCPVLAVPTSIGYGAAFGGVAALLTMLNSCSAGVGVVNIDAGFKAGYLAARMIHRMNQRWQEWSNS